MSITLPSAPPKILPGILSSDVKASNPYGTAGKSLPPLASAVIYGASIYPPFVPPEAIMDADYADLFAEKTDLEEKDEDGSEFGAFRSLASLALASGTRRESSSDRGDTRGKTSVRVTQVKDSKAPKQVSFSLSNAALSTPATRSWDLCQLGDCREVLLKFLDQKSGNLDARTQALYTRISQKLETLNLARMKTEVAGNLDAIRNKKGADGKPLFDSESAFLSTKARALADDSLALFDCLYQFFVREFCDLSAYSLMDDVGKQFVKQMDLFLQEGFQKRLFQQLVQDTKARYEDFQRPGAEQSFYVEAGVGLGVPYLAGLTISGKFAEAIKSGDDGRIRDIKIFSTEVKAGGKFRKIFDAFIGSSYIRKQTKSFKSVEDFVQYYIKNIWKSVIFSMNDAMRGPFNAYKDRQVFHAGKKAHKHAIKHRYKFQEFLTHHGVLSKYEKLHMNSYSQSVKSSSKSHGWGVRAALGCVFKFFGAKLFGDHERHYNTHSRKMIYPRFFMEHSRTLDTAWEKYHIKELGASFAKNQGQTIAGLYTNSQFLKLCSELKKTYHEYVRHTNLYDLGLTEERDKHDVAQSRKSKNVIKSLFGATNRGEVKRNVYLLFMHYFSQIDFTSGLSESDFHYITDLQTYFTTGGMCGNESGFWDEDMVFDSRHISAFSGSDKTYSQTRSSRIGGKVELVGLGKFKATGEHLSVKGHPIRSNNGNSVIVTISSPYDFDINSVRDTLAADSPSSALFSRMSKKQVKKFIETGGEALEAVLKNTDVKLEPANVFTIGIVPAKQISLELVWGYENGRYRILRARKLVGKGVSSELEIPVGEPGVSLVLGAGAHKTRNVGERFFPNSMTYLWQRYRGIRDGAKRWEEGFDAWLKLDENSKDLWQIMVNWEARSSNVYRQMRDIFRHIKTSISSEDYMALKSEFRKIRHELRADSQYYPARLKEYLSFLHRVMDLNYLSELESARKLWRERVAL